MKLSSQSTLLLLSLFATAKALAQDTDTSNCPTEPKCTGDQEIAVFGHRSPDTDAISSAIIYAYELRNPIQGGYKDPLCAKAYVNSDTPNRETLFVLDYFGIDVPPTIDQITAHDIFATVDTNNVDEMPNGAADVVADNLHSIVDHHKLTGLVATKPLAIDIRPIGSAGSVLYQRYREVGRTIPGEGCPINIAGLMMATILSDTLGFRSPTTTQQDIDAVVEFLAPVAGVTDVEAFFDAMISAKSDITGMSAMDLVNVDSKVYAFTDPDGNSFDLRISVLESGKPERILNMADEISKACDQQLVIDQETRGPTMRATLFFAIDILNAKATFIPSSSSYATELVMNGEFPKGSVTDDENDEAADFSGIVVPEVLLNGQIVLDTVRSRKLQIIPGLTVSTGVVPYYSSESTSTTANSGTRKRLLRGRKF